MGLSWDWVGALGVALGEEQVEDAQALGYDGVEVGLADHSPIRRRAVHSGAETEVLRWLEAATVPLEARADVTGHEAPSVIARG